MKNCTEGLLEQACLVHKDKGMASDAKWHFSLLAELGQILGNAKEC